MGRRSCGGRRSALGKICFLPWFNLVKPAKLPSGSAVLTVRSRGTLQRMRWRVPSGEVLAMHSGKFANRRVAWRVDQRPSSAASRFELRGMERDRHRVLRRARRSSSGSAGTAIERRAPWAVLQRACKPPAHPGRSIPLASVIECRLGWSEPEQVIEWSACLEGQRAQRPGDGGWN